MTDKFELLPEEKRLGITNAALDNFSKNGYKNASTNEIVKEAGISKGLLFHYFSTKLNLFTYLYKKSIDIIKIHIYDYIDVNEPDYLIRLKQVGIVKLQLSKIYPNIFNFLTAAYFDKDPSIIKIVVFYNREIINEGYNRLSEGVDFSKFREDLDLSMILNSITATLQDWSEKYILENQIDGVIKYDIKEINEELDKHYNFFRKSFYKIPLL